MKRNVKYNPKKEIKYISFYNRPDIPIKRVAALSTVNKIGYICNALHRAGFDVHIISPSWFIEPDEKWTWGVTTYLDTHTKLTLCPSYGTRSRLNLYIKIFISLTWLFYYLITYVNKEDKILVYHSPWLALPIRWAKKIKGFKLILEVEEIYGEVWKINNALKKMEKKLLSCADYYVAVSEILAEKLGSKAKIIIYGSYVVSSPIKEMDRDSTVNIVYAGSIDYIKGGAYKALKCLLHLPNKYVFHFCGYGGKEEINELKWQIAEINKSLGRDASIYHGLIPDQEFSSFLHTCDIAINPQNDGDNMTTLFPSKIIKYLSHNLRVVSTRIKSIERSQISKLITFPENETPEAFAQAIKSIDFAIKFDSRLVIKQLDEQFVKDIGELMGDKNA